MNTKWLSLLCALFLSSCQVYRSHFDTPPSKGVPCTSVSDIQEMIVETPEGNPDLFLPCRRNSSSCTPSCTDRTSQPTLPSRIWIKGHYCHDLFVEGHYLYFQKTKKEDSAS